MATLNNMIEEVLSREGGYVNDPRDAGGETNFGITVATARKNGYFGPMSTLPRDIARSIYKSEYYLRPGFDKVAAAYPRVGNELFDTGVNMGPAVATQFLQRALSALTDDTLDPDGNLGGKTLSALAKYRAKRGAAGEEVLLKALDGLQAERYLALAERRPANEAFLYGWLANRIGNA